MSEYKNPFAEYNSNIMSAEQIAEFFAEPFALLNTTLDVITGSRSTMIFEGGRGTGKTMLLRQLSYNVQKLSSNNYSTFLNKVKAEKYVGIYFRVDNPLLRSLDSITKADDKNFVETVFTHYFELTVFKDYLEVVKIFLYDSNLNIEDEYYKKIIDELKELLVFDFPDNTNSIDDLIKFVIDEINYIWKYQSDKSIDIRDALVFSPKCSPFMQGRLTNEFFKSSILNILGLDDVEFLILIDEFENFSIIQQRIINTAMRFTKNYGARLRIGMRPYGFETFGTLTDEEFIREGRDYIKVEFGSTFVKKGEKNPFPELIREIANKRLKMIPFFNDRTIVDFLGEKENLIEEAKDIVKKKTTHIVEYLKIINEMKKLRGENEIDSRTFSNLRDENPLYEMENLLLLMRGKSLEYVEKAFSDYKNGINSEERKKYSNDYDKKYQLSFVFVLCSIYRREHKWYYGLTDYCLLSSGIIGLFLELCREAFDKAYFRNYERLLEGKIIDSVIQTEAAIEIAYRERRDIDRIKTHGRELRIFVQNIGDAFSVIHKDKGIRYPETNMFPLGLLNPYNMKLIETACKWSLIMKKPNAQDAKGGQKKQDIFLLNRIFAPIYKISCRIRGGLNPITLDDNYFDIQFNPQNVLQDQFKIKNKNSKIKIINNDNDMGQISLFEMPTSEDINLKNN